ncbi:TRAP transporter permease [Arenibaculum sp.]|jgi:TRAP transporter 4TM/12TM fusion protein|uniref:TRAP transporter permease n=1 Tax=Arenibaculum sp. TaxID=2865862 RepID=UPI002E1510FE|nr:TRAP transporter permease [Arenibaculum sp.]
MAASPVPPSQPASQPAAQPEIAGEHGPLHGSLPDRALPVGKILFAIAVAFSVFQIWTAAFTPLSSLVVRSIHVGFLLLLTFALSAARQPGRAAAARDWLLGALAFALATYHWIFEVDILLRAGWPNLTDLVVGSIMVVLVFEAARRIMGFALPAICGLFLGYALFGEYLPSPLDHRGFGFDQVADHMFLGTEGIFGTPIYVSSTYIFLFILFGSFLERAGMIGLFNDIALGSVGHTRGGPGKVAVVSSAMMGTINGSGVANVVTTGQFTIPLMKQFGYRPAFAGAVEATASMGGQIMPPVMGAVAFIMAETINVPYVEVVRAALIPALLYFATVLWMVHLEAGRLNLLGLPRSELPNAFAALKAKWHLIIPLAILVYLLFTGYTPLFAGTVGLALTVVLILASALTARIGPMAARILFWIALGALTSLFLDYGIQVVFTIVAGLVALNLLHRGGRETLVLAVDSLAEGAKNALAVGVACALVGVIIGTMTLTGLGSNFVRVIVSVGEGSLFLSLVLTMVTCLILGMGIPTIPNYIITSSLVGPALLELGVPLIVSHMFVFYFGIMADLTPPVALAAFAAAPIARAPGLRIGIQCLRIAIAGFVVPFMAVYSPALMLQSDDPVAIGYIVIKALLSVGLWGAGSIGFLFAPLSWYERLWATAGAFMMVVALPITDEIGFLLCGSFLVFHVWRVRRTVAGTA